MATQTPIRAETTICGSVTKVRAQLLSITILSQRSGQHGYLVRSSHLSLTFLYYIDPFLLFGA